MNFVNRWMGTQQFNQGNGVFTALLYTLDYILAVVFQGTVVKREVHILVVFGQSCLDGIMVLRAGVDNKASTSNIGGTTESFC